MGFNCSLVAIAGHSPDRVHDALGLAPTGAIESFPESSIASAHTMDGGTLLWIGLLSHDTQWSPDPDVDLVFDVPVELFVSAGGRRCDDDFETRGPSPWQVVEPIERQLRSE